MKLSMGFKKKVGVKFLQEKGYWFENVLAGLPTMDYLTDALIEKRLLTPLENGIGAEGVWMVISK